MKARAARNAGVALGALPEAPMNTPAMVEELIKITTQEDGYWLRRVERLSPRRLNGRAHNKEADVVYNAAAVSFRSLSAHFFPKRETLQGSV